jgi:hypothetical protein
MSVEGCRVSTSFHRVPSHFLLTSFSTRCHVTIKGEAMPDIVLHVELDVTELMYTPGHVRGDELACMIFRVSLNRPTPWAQNGSKFNRTPQFCYPQYNFKARTWRGCIGVTLDCTFGLWHIKTYRAMITSLASCFLPRWCSQKTCVVSVISELTVNLSSVIL